MWRRGEESRLVRAALSSSGARRPKGRGLGARTSFDPRTPAHRHLSESLLAAWEQKGNNRRRSLKEVKVSVFFVGLVLTVWGLLRLQMSTGRAQPVHVHAEGAPSAPPSETFTRPRNISRGGEVRLSSQNAPRAPGSLCERAFVSSTHRSRRLNRPRVFRPARWVLRGRLSARCCMRTLVLRA